MHSYLLSHCWVSLLGENGLLATWKGFEIREIDFLNFLLCPMPVRPGLRGLIIQVSEVAVLIAAKPCSSLVVLQVYPAPRAMREGLLSLLLALDKPSRVFLLVLSQGERMATGCAVFGRS